MIVVILFVRYLCSCNRASDINPTIEPRLRYLTLDERENVDSDSLLLEPREDRVAGKECGEKTAVIK